MSTRTPESEIIATFPEGPAFHIEDPEDLYERLQAEQVTLLSHSYKDGGIDHAQVISEPTEDPTDPGLRIEGTIVLDDSSYSPSSTALAFDNTLNTLASTKPTEKTFFEVTRGDGSSYFIKDLNADTYSFVIIDKGRGIIRLTNYAAHEQAEGRLTLEPPRFSEVNPDEVLNTYGRTFSFVTQNIFDISEKSLLKPIPSKALVVRRPALSTLMESAGVTVTNDEVISRDYGRAFEGIYGYDDIVAELEDVALSLRNPELLEEWNVVRPTSILLAGPDGTGKAMLTEALAQEAGAKQITIDCVDLYDKSIISGGQHLSTRMREVIKKAYEDQERRPVILHLQNIDAIMAAHPNSTAAQEEAYDRVARMFARDITDITDRDLPIVVVSSISRPASELPNLTSDTSTFERVLATKLPDQATRAEILMDLFGRRKDDDSLSLGGETDDVTILDPGVDILDIAKLLDGMSAGQMSKLVDQLKWQKVRQQMRGQTAEPITLSYIETFLSK